MNVIKNLVFLGFAYELVWRNKALFQKITLFTLKTSLASGGRDVYGLFSNGPGTAIFVLPLKSFEVENIKGQQATTAKLSGRWAGYTSDIALRFNIPNTAARLKKIGVLEKIEYTSDKLERSGDRKGDFSLYTHKYNTPLHLYADREKNPRVFGAKLNSKRIITSRGLVG